MTVLTARWGDDGDEQERAQICHLLCVASDAVPLLVPHVWDRSFFPADFIGQTNR
jgi:hypothetical protein